MVSLTIESLTQALSIPTIWVMKRIFPLILFAGMILTPLLSISSPALADPTRVACEDGTVGHGSDSSVACAGRGGPVKDTSKIGTILNDPANQGITDPNNCGGVKTSIDYGCGTDKGGAIYGFLRGIIKFASGLVGLVVILMLIIGGIRYITSAGDPKLVVSAKNQIVNAVTGLVLFGLMLAILNFLLPGGIIG